MTEGAPDDRCRGARRGHHRRLSLAQQRPDLRHPAPVPRDGHRRRAPIGPAPRQSRPGLRLPRASRRRLRSTRRRPRQPRNLLAGQWREIACCAPTAAARSPTATRSPRSARRRTASAHRCRTRSAIRSPPARAGRATSTSQDEVPKREHPPAAAACRGEDARSRGSRPGSAVNILGSRRGDGVGSLMSCKDEEGRYIPCRASGGSGGRLVRRCQPAA